MHSTHPLTSAYNSLESFVGFQTMIKKLGKNVFAFFLQKCLNFVCNLVFPSSPFQQKAQKLKVEDF